MNREFVGFTIRCEGMALQTVLQRSTRSVEAVVRRSECAELESLIVALLYQAPYLWVRRVERQQTPNHLRPQHVRVVSQNGRRQPENVSGYSYPHKCCKFIPSFILHSSRPSCSSNLFSRLFTDITYSCTHIRNEILR